MPDRKQTVGALVRLGVKYGPIAYAGWRSSPRSQLSWNRPRSQPDDPKATALEHADHLIDGSVLPVFDGDTRVWVVFSADVPVASHPVVRTPLATLLEHYDLAKRVRPGSGEATQLDRGDAEAIPRPLNPPIRLTVRTWARRRPRQG